MPLQASDYLDNAEALNDMAMKAGSPEAQSLYATAGQVNAIQAVAAAVVRLAEAVENLAWQAGKGKT